MFGEYLNVFSQLPYFVAVLELENVLPMINVFNSIDPLAALFDIYVITVFAITPLLIVFFVLLYYVIAGKVQNG